MGGGDRIGSSLLSWNLEILSRLTEIKCIKDNSEESKPGRPYPSFAHCWRSGLGGRDVMLIRK